MPTTNSNTWKDSEQQPEDTTHFCPACNETVLRDVQILEALQSVRRVLNGTDGLKSPWMKLARIKAAVDEALRLLEAGQW